MDWLAIATNLLFISIVLNAGVYTLGLVDLGHDSLSDSLGLLNLPTATLNQTSMNTKDFSLQQFDNSSNCNITVPLIGTTFGLPFICQATTISGKIFDFITRFPFFFTDVLLTAGWPSSIVLFIGLIFMFIDYGALLYFILLVFRSLTGGS